MHSDPTTDRAPSIPTPPTPGRRPRPRTAGVPVRAPRGQPPASTALLVTALALLLVALVLPAIYRQRWAGMIFPGVRVAGIAVGGMSRAEADAALAAAGLDPAAPVTLSLGGERGVLPEGVVALDLGATLDDAFAVGRTGHRARRLAAMLTARFSEPSLPLRVVHDEGSVRDAVAGIAADFDRPARDALLIFEGPEVELAHPETGRALDPEGAVQAILDAARAGVWPIRDIELPVRVDEPVVTDAEAAFEQASWLLAGPIELRAFNQTWNVPPEQSVTLLGSEVVDHRIALTVDRERLSDLLKPVTESVTRTARNARFSFDETTDRLSVVEPGVTGRAVNIERTAERLLSLPNPGPRTLQVAIDFVAPGLPDTASAETLGIRELIHEETSFFRGSSPDRVHNVALAASKFDGALIPPDTVFSFNEQIGEITEAVGYKETLIIVDGATADGVGGGVCQVSTTLFRAAFWSGLPIVSRTAHGYRVAYYEQGQPMGLDATVYSPVLDLTFRNDTPGWILIETETDTANMSVTFRFYGTDPGREVELVGPTVSAETPPPAPRVEVDPTLPPGTSTVVELARSGASVVVKRKISGGDLAEPIEEAFYSVYRPTGAVTAVGPSLEPEPAQGASGQSGGDLASAPDLAGSVGPGPGPAAP